ncbi:unnamed protein product [Euphydryas editha]|uniref:Uncharacterized protein n=1 Tax=Euphydryas editha TaxID=104508 RepID=A0AAU9UZR4_EUPED|nr:unnamed protein product [Euphydryas editha]
MKSESVVPHALNVTRDRRREVSTKQKCFKLELRVVCMSADTSFQPFFNYVDMRALLENFCVYHVNAPGQEEGAPTLPEE